MSTKPDDHATQHDGAAASANSPAGEPGHAPEYQELWLALAKRRWTSLVVVPADAEVPAADVAKKLADVGKELIEEPVTAISVTRLGYDSARALSDLQQYVDRARQGAERNPGGPNGDAGIVEVGGRPGDAGATSGNQALALAPSARLVISIPPVVNEPLGLAVAQFADAVVLTFHLGKTRLSEARRTIELIGRDRIVGCFIVR
ncbi:MAG: hypothetical protein QM704_13240 [Anaeromyxobacteraceae bacterium]